MQAKVSELQEQAVVREAKARGWSQAAVIRHLIERWRLGTDGIDPATGGDVSEDT